MESIEFGGELRRIDIGGGEFVNVSFGTDLKEGTSYKQKILITQVPTNALDRSVIDLLKLVDHRNILRLLKTYNLGNYYRIISSYQEFNLNSLIYEKNHVFESKETGEFILQIIEGINWLHNLFLFHSYINPKDIYLQNYSTIKISGFYFSEIFESADAITSRPNRPLPYACPREEMESHLGLKYDIWCIGLVLFEFCFRHSPETELETNLNSSWNNNISSLPKEFKFFKYIFRLLLEYDFKVRKSTGELLNDPSMQTLIALRDSSLQKIGGEMGQYVVHECINHQTTYKVFDNKANEYRLLKLRSTFDSVSDVYREIEILTQCKQDSFPYVITYFDHFVYQTDYVCIVTEYSEFGSLKDQLKELKINRGHFDANEMYELVRQLISGLKFIHDSLGIIHRLIKPSNIIMFQTKEGKRALKYCDFYFARKLIDIDFSNSHLSQITRASIVSDYTAPEMVFMKNYDWLVDVWSLGCIIYEMITLNKPFDTSKFNIFRRDNAMDHVPQLADGNIYKFLVNMMLQINPRNRASAQRCYEHFRSLSSSS